MLILYTYIFIYLFLFFSCIFLQQESYNSAKITKKITYKECTGFFPLSFCMHFAKINMIKIVYSSDKNGKTLKHYFVTYKFSKISCVVLTHINLFYPNYIKFYVT